jgi:putative transposase
MHHLWPLGDGELGRWMHWLLTAHVRRYQRHYWSTGHVWQGRYIERNPSRAGLVESAQQWPWSSLAAIAAGQAEPPLDPGPARI